MHENAGVALQTQLLTNSIRVHAVLLCLVLLPPAVQEH
jgi:hypothetical protein